MVRALDRKLLRELTRLRGQVASIALVVACGVAVYVASSSAHACLEEARLAYYARQRMPDLFARVERAPTSVLAAARRVPGVARVDDRVVTEVTFDAPGLLGPALGRLVSVPAEGQPALSALRLARGRWVQAGRPDEALTLEPFARAHGLAPGDVVDVLVEGRRVSLTLVGTVLSPEYVFPIVGTELFAEDRRAGVFWMERTSLAERLQMGGAFDELVAKLEPGASVNAVIEALDELLEPYGAAGALARSDQASDRFLVNELEQLEVQATVVPALFLGISAFLLHVVLSRLVHTQREQIATLKALGYGDLTLGLHYLELAAAIAIAGSLLGIALGAALGDALIALYGRFFRLPDLHFALSAPIVVTAVAVSLASAVAGAVGVVRSVARLPAAEGMRPEPPPSYHRSRLERLGVAALVPASARMVVRDLERRPLRALTTVLGAAAAAAIVIAGLFWTDAVDHLVELELRAAQREDLTVAFTQTLDARAVRELAHLPGVLAAEPTRTLSVRLVFGPREVATPLQGLRARSELRRLVDAQGRLVALPSQGLVLTRNLADALGARTGDPLTVERTDGRDRPRPAIVAAVVDAMVGKSAFMELEALHAWVGEAPSADGALLLAADDAVPALLARLAELPRVASAVTHASMMAFFQQETTAAVVAFAVVLGAFAAAIAVGVVYNAARIALEERSRDLATLRVLGLTRAEVARILLGEIGAQVLIALPLGLGLGMLFARLLSEAVVDPELFRIPAIVSPATLATAALVVVGSALVAGLLVRRRLDRLDLLAALKASDR